ncbi:MAG: MerR family transcriptional regulator [Desulfofustis sp. PB-SRB1]|nr:MerR family transcriptional regulator [Desulfofustis sp. PB-SRB1]MBM1002699.1 MerR family transcriptional regulator [Desulfofustis sp. PB-SRB1]HBH29710.1 MerR family DNA-binding transcriptional regulator [Desulfofustis sp.]HBH32636.1 MerR family DNA-binding transcriptional regulator [Desulfofustis sp.]
MISQDEAIFTIGMAAKMLGVHQRTLRNYEDSGLVKPMRRGKWRYYSMRDVQWIECLRTMIHEQGISINAVKKLLSYTPCWNIVDCPFEKRKQCSAFFSNALVPRKVTRLEPLERRRKKVVAG